MIITPHWLNWSSERLQLEWLKAMKDPWHFLTTFCYTKDEHDLINPVKLIPPKQYLKFLVRVWQAVPLLLVAKSRKMMVSWIFCNLYLWDSISGYGRLNFFQSKKEDWADELVQRAHFTWRFLPGHPYKPEAQYSYCRLKFPDRDSMIKGVPQGEDPIVSETGSNILSDEMALQILAEKAYVAAKPTIDGGGKYTGVSTARPGTFFKRLVYDEE